MWQGCPVNDVSVLSSDEHHLHLCFGPFFSEGEFFYATQTKKKYHCVHSQSNSGKNARIPQHQGDSEVVGPIVQVLHAVDLHANQ